MFFNFSNMELNLNGNSKDPQRRQRNRACFSYEITRNDVAIRLHKTKYNITITKVITAICINFCFA